MEQVTNQILIGHCLEVLKGIPANSVHATVTSPPYWGLRDYLLEPVYWPAVSYSPMPGLPQITIPEQEASLGLEPDIWAFVGHIVAIYREVWRVLRPDATCWINLGDSYITSPPGNNGKHKHNPERGDGAFRRRQLRQLGHGENMQAIYQKPKDLKMKDLAGIPWRCAYALQADGWYLRSDVIWAKPNPMPESIQDRPTKAHEYVFLLSKSERYFYDAEAVREETLDPGKARPFRNGDRGTLRNDNGRIWEPQPGRNKRSVWSVSSQPYAAHFATFPPKLIEPMILASTSEYGCCSSCGNPWRRVVEKRPAKETRPRPFAHNGNDDRRDTGRIYEETESVTTGWQPTCSCEGAEVVPAVVLDPFFGSGTTGQVAIKHRRRFVGIDLNPTYAQKLAPERLNGTQIQMI